MPKKLNLIIVLSHLMDEFGNLNEESISRARKASEIYYKNKHSIIITSGWSYRKDCKISIALAFKNYLHSIHEIPLQKIIIETNSKDTVGDAVFTKKHIVSSFEESNIFIVTSSYHVKRAKEIFEFVYGNEYKLKFISVSSFPSNKSLNSEKESYFAFKKTFKGLRNGNIEEIYQRMKSNHPLYNE